MGRTVHMSGTKNTYTSLNIPTYIMTCAQDIKKFKQWAAKVSCHPCSGIKYYVDAHRGVDQGSQAMKFVTSRHKPPSENGAKQPGVGANEM